jgi:hypothetical protein
MTQFKITSEMFANDEVDSIIKSFDSIQIPNFPLPKINSLKSGETFELLDLPYCDEKFLVQYNANTDYIKNDGKQIFQNVSKPYEQITQIGKDKQGLSQISWKRSFFTFNGKKVGLELHFTHVNPANGRRIRVVFPLSLSQIETFAQDELSSSLDKLGALNVLIKKDTDVPQKIEGQVNVGKLLTFDLCEPAKLILQQSKFFFAETPTGELLLIAKPQKFNYDIGMKIRENLEEPDYSILKP